MSEAISARRKLLLWLATLLGPPLLLALALEAALRIALPPPDPRSQATLLETSGRKEVTDLPDANPMGMVMRSDVPGLVYELKPNRRWNFLGVEIRTNSHGFRGAEFGEAKPAGVLRVVGLGDSVMFGWGVPEPSTYMGRLRTALGVRFGSGVEVLNCAVPGYNTQQQAILLARRCARFSPDLVLVGYTLNDGEPALYQDPPQPSLLEHSRLFELFRDLWVARLRPPDRDQEGRERIVRGLEQLAAVARRQQIPVVFLIYPQRLRQYDETLPERTARRLGFVMIDLYAAFDVLYRERGLDGIEDVYLSATDAHPNAEGHQMIASAAEPVLAAQLEASP